MSKATITVEDLGKMYRLGATQKRTETFQDVLKGLALAPVRRFRHLGEQTADQEEFWALKDVSFEVQPGEVVGIIGRNGAGKSTLLKVLSRIVEPTRGQAILRGRVASLLEVGTGFHPELTGRENIYLNGSILGMKRREIEAKFDEMVAFAEVEKFLDTPVKRYSSGMYVRLAFAVAAHLEPEILIVDEVLAVGDVHFQKKCLGKMEDVVNRGRTVLFVSHQISAINQLCRQIIWLDQGNVVGVGPTSAILPRYLEVGISHDPRVSPAKPVVGTEFHFSMITIENDQGSPSSELDARLPFTVRLHYEVSKPLPGVEMAIRIRTSDSVSVFTAVYSDYSDVSKMDKRPGSHVASIRVPGHFLMPGSYMLSAHAFQDRGRFERLHILDNIIRFNICETGTKMGKYTDKKSIGVVLVDFPWEDEALDV